MLPPELNISFPFVWLLCILNPIREGAVWKTGYRCTWTLCLSPLTSPTRFEGE